MWPTTTIPPAVSALRDMLDACPSWTDAGGAQSHVHYPTINPSGVLDNACAMPAALIERMATHRRPYAEGARALPSGELQLHLYLDVATFPGISDAEAFADVIADELLQQEPGLMLNDATVGEASDPTPAALAANQAPHSFTAYRSVTISLQYGLSA